MADFQLNLNINGVDTAVASVEDLEAALKATKTEMNTLQIGSEAFNVAAANAQKLDSALKNVKLATEGVDTKQLAGSFAKLGETVVGGFAIATNAISIFGKENEAVSAAAVKAQQAIAVVMGARAIAEGVVEGRVAARLILEKVSMVNTALMTTLQSSLTAVMGAQAAATSGASVAMAALNAIMNLNPIILVATALAALVGAMVIFNDTSAESEELTKAFNDALKEQKDITSGLQTSLQNTQADYLALTGEISKTDAELRKQGIAFVDEAGRLDAKYIESKKKILDQAKEDADSWAVSQGDAVIITENANNRILELDKAHKENIRLLQLDYDTKYKIARKQEADALAKEEEEKTKKLAEEAKKRFSLRTANEKEFADALKKIEDDTQASKDKLADLTNKNEVSRLGREKASKLANAQTLYDAAIKSAEKLGATEAEVKKRLAKESLDRDISSINDYYIKKVDIEQNKERDSFEAKRDLLNAQYELLISSNDKEAQSREETYRNISQLQQEKTDKILSINAQEKADLLKADEDYTNLIKQREDSSIADPNNTKSLESVASLELAKQGLKDEIAASADAKRTATNEEYNAKQIAAARDLNDAIRNNELSFFDGISLIKLQNVQKDAEAKRTYEELMAQARLAFGTEKETEYQEAIKQIKDDYDTQVKENGKASEDEIFAYKVQKLQEFQATAQEYAQIATAGVQLLTEIQKGAAQEESQAIAQKYSAEENALRAKLNKGEITKKEYDKREKVLNDAKAKAEYDAKKKAFEQEKKLRIASTIISGIMGALQAFTGAMQLGPIAGPIVGGILAGLVVAGTAVTVSNISKQQFDGGAQPLTPIDAGAGEDAAGAGQDAIQQSSAGGFTGFAPSVAGQVGGSTTDPERTGPVKVVVVESDITNAQRRVSVAESNATF